MVVDVRAVHTWFCFSSAWPGDGTLISPRAAKPKVHFFTFILFLLRSVVDMRFMRFCEQSHFAPAPNGAFAAESRENPLALTTVFLAPWRTCSRHGYSLCA